MAIVTNNSQQYPDSIHTPRLGEEQNQLFVATVLTVDWERTVVTLQDIRTGSILREVMLPAASSSAESTDVVMPEEGSTYLCAPIHYTGGFVKIALITPVVTDKVRAQDAIGYKLSTDTPVYNRRKRGLYRKAYPGQRATSMSSGYTEKTDTGWDKSAQDLSRDKLDSLRRQWTQTTGRKIVYTDSGLEFQGAVNRPGAAGVAKVTLPDGSLDYPVFLAPGAQPSDRYVGGKPDVIAFAEQTTRVQEYALDYPLPSEVFQTSLLDTVLGTVADPWQRTTIKTLNGISYDSETYLANQTFDAPVTGTPVGPTLNEGVTPQRRGFIKESVSGTLVGYNLFDTITYGKVLKPVLTPYTQLGRFGADFDSSYLPVVDSTDHVEARLAASCHAVRFPYDQNTTRFDVTKEGFTSFEIGATLPKENIPLNNSPNSPYEHPHGAGRSLEGHLVGSLKLVIGKNRDEEDAIDLQALGQTVLRIGADDTTLPNRGRTVLTQIRSKADQPQARTLNYWTQPKFGIGDAGVLTNKTGMENISLRMGLDGGLVARVGARASSVLRKHLVNGYVDGQGKTPYSATNPSRIDSHSPGRPVYTPSGDATYRFNDLTQVGTPQLSSIQGFYSWSGSPVSNADATGLSVDLHAVRDILLRVGANADGQSLLLDFLGGIVTALGADNFGRSITAALAGGVEITIQPNKQGKALSLEINGDIDITHKGNFQYLCTGDSITECTSLRHITKTDHIVSAQKMIHSALTRLTNEAPDIVNNQGLYQSDENS